MAKQQNRPARMKGTLWMFDVRKWQKMDLIMLAAVLLLVLTGLVMLFSVSYPSGYYQYDDSFYYIGKQAWLAAAGIVAMLAAACFNYRIFEKLCWPLYGISVALLVVVMFVAPPEGLEEFHRWITLFGVTFQPSEIAKFSVAITSAHLCVKYQKEMRSSMLWKKALWKGIAPPMLALVPMLVLLYLEPHMSGLIILAGIAALVVFAGGAHWLWCTLVAGAGVTLVSVITFWADILPQRVQDRLNAWQDPFSIATGDGLQTVQGLYAIGSGGLKGLGIGMSRQKHLWVPEPYNDWIFSIVCEEIGFIGAVAILLLFGVLIFRGFLAAMRCRDRFGALLAVGITGQVALQVFFNVGVVTNLLPPTGISLPFFSYGGTSLLMLLGEMGVLLAISAAPREKKPKKTEETDRPAEG